MPNTYNTRLLKYDLHVCGIDCVSSGSIFVGALVLIGLGFLSNFLAVSLGRLVFSVSNGAVIFGIGSFFALVILSTLLMFISGWIVGYLSLTCCYRRRFREIFRYFTLSLALIVTIFLTTQAGLFISNYGHASSKDVPAKSITPVALNDTKWQASHHTLSDREESLLVAIATFLLFGIGALCVTFGKRIGRRFRGRKKNRECLGYFH